MCCPTVYTDGVKGGTVKTVEGGGGSWVRNHFFVAYQDPRVLLAAPQVALEVKD